MPMMNLHPTAVRPAGITNRLRRRLLYMHVTSYDWAHGGLCGAIKFIDRDSVEYSLAQTANHDRNERRMARQTLINAMALIDPVWGGAWQYSTGSCWTSPHHGKPMSAQGGTLRIYSLAYGLMREHAFLIAARRIRDYLKNFLQSPCGAFYAGQAGAPNGINPSDYFNLSHEERIQHGYPAIDRRLLSRENGWAVEALATFYESTGERSALIMAQQAAAWLLESCRLPNGGYRRSPDVNNIPCLSDTLAGARAMLQLYRVTADRHYLESTLETAEFIKDNFRHPEGGFTAETFRGKVTGQPLQIDENISATRFFNLLSHYSGDLCHMRLARHGFSHLVRPEIATARMEEAGILLADEELASEPVRIFIIGAKSDPAAQRLHDTALRAYGWYKVIKWIEADSTTVTEAYARIDSTSYRHDPITQPDRLAWMIKSR